MPSPKPLAVVTRPRGEAEALAAELEARGFDVLIEPMTRIVMADTILPPLAGYAALAFTSANGVRAFAQLTSERGTLAYAVGSGTAAALREAGFQDIRIGSGNMADLAVLIRRELSSGARLLHLTGDVVAGDLAALLEPADIRVERVVLYNAVPAAQLSRRLADSLYACTIDYVLFFSPRTARIFGTLVGRAGLVEKCRSSVSLCLSEAVAMEAGVLPWKGISVAVKPAADALLDLLPPAG